MRCSACGRSWGGSHRCGETVAEAAANARIAELETEKERLRGLVRLTEQSIERMEALLQ